jgi:hypothetical protein
VTPTSVSVLELIMSSLELLLLVLAIFGGIDLAGKGVGLTLTAFPKLLSAQSQAWKLMADSVAIPVFRRKAVATRVEEVLNQTAFHLQQFLPPGWIKRARVRWVRNSQAAQLKDGTIVLRIRPAANPDHNLMQTMWNYFNGALFPNTRDILPDDFLSGISLAVTRAGLEESHPYLIKEFDEVFLRLVADDKQEVRDFFGDCVRLNEYGLLMGPFLREMDFVANNARFHSERVKLPEMVREILVHMLGFQPFLRKNKPEADWSYQGGCSSYGFLLVSRPPELRPGVDAYVKRAREKLYRGVKRLYVIGRYEERDFVWQVTSALLSIRELKGLEVFSLFRDYRGEAGGVGALLGVDQILAKLKLSQRSLESLAIPQIEAKIPNVSEGPDKVEELESAELRELEKIADDLIVQLSDYEGAWISLAEFGGELRKQMPGFTPQRYGGRNLVSVLRKLNSLEFDERGAGLGKAVFVRMRSATHAAAQHALAAELAILQSKIVSIMKYHAHGDGWIFLGQLGHLLKSELPEFDYARFGASSFHELICKIPLVEVEERGEGHSKTYVRAI